MVNPSSQTRSLGWIGSLLMLLKFRNVLNFFRSLFAGRRPIFVNNLTRWFWYGDEEYCKCCNYEALFTSLENASLINFEYAAASGCRRCRIILHGINQFSDRWQGQDKRSVRPQLWDSSTLGVQVLVSYPGVNAAKEPLGSLPLEFYFHQGGHALYPWMEARPRIEARSDTTASFDLVKTWMSRCAGEHKLCEATEDYTPTRLVNVKTLTLVNHPPTSTRYIALSHCWGVKKDRQVPMPETTKHTLRHRMRGIPWAELTKTFQDAFFITRELGFEYVWIDSLCIIQDDSEDWAREASLMSSVYGGADLVISAARAEIGDAGIFHTRPAPHEVEGVMVRPRMPHDIFIDPNARKFGDNPVFSRGWCFQERLLARRVVHYTANELVWECNEDLWCECESIKTLNMKNFKVRLGSILRQDDAKARFDIWAEVVRAYTSRKLTFETDRLAALSGIAHRFQTPYLGRYLAGLWESNLPDALLWEENPATAGSRPYVERCAQVPSWSWLSMTKCMIRPHFQSRHPCYPMALVKEAQCYAPTLNPNGDILHGSILLEAPVVGVVLQKMEVKLVAAPVPTYIRTVLVNPLADGEASFHPDSCFPGDLDVAGTEFFCLAIKRVEVKARFAWCLVLREAVIPKKYVRVGITFGPLNWFEGVSTREIELV